MRHVADELSPSCRPTAAAPLVWKVMRMYPPRYRTLASLRCAHSGETCGKSMSAIAAHPIRGTW